ncbi:hypothetical protein GWK47_027681 [Chionoecetes opilio]|uniref:Uncharacterized protein n=1 Tax=Chionoecetes opilio TaxID=41210 RepID=A0A8J8WD93_CHIOP|nr:hypothetical protein GWK47_027681 [Chionoecetes opilio]
MSPGLHQSGGQDGVLQAGTAPAIQTLQITTNVPDVPRGRGGPGLECCVGRHLHGCRLNGPGRSGGMAWFGNQLSTRKEQRASYLPGTVPSHRLCSCASSQDYNCFSRMVRPRNTSAYTPHGRLGHQVAEEACLLIG